MNLVTPCATCWTRDPRAYIDDPALADKLLVCLAESRTFACHHPVPGADRLPPCAGFTGLALVLAGKTLTQLRDTVRKIEMHFLEKFLRSDDPVAVQVRAFNGPDFTAQDLRWGMKVCELAERQEAPHE